MKKSLMAMVLLMIFCFAPLSGFSAEPGYTIQSFPAESYPSLIQPQLNVLYEDFTATWCGWCHYSYEIFDSLYAEYGDRILHIRYHNQDLLSMPTIRERANFYKVTGYPTMVFNGDNKIIGADATTYPAVKKVVEDLFLQTPVMGMNSFGIQDGQTLQMTVILQSYLDVPLTGQFLTVLTESQVVDADNKVFNFVSRLAFPDFKGLTLTLEPNTLYYLKFSRQIPDASEVTQFEAVSFFQNFTTGKIYNSCFYSFNSLPILQSTPLPFETGVRRDISFEVVFKEALVISTLQDSLFLLIDQNEKMQALEWEYDSVKKILHLYPVDLLKKNTGYALWMMGGKNSLTSSAKHYLRTHFILPFFTSESPDLTIQLSQWQLDLGEVWPIDKPKYELVLEETHGIQVRVKVTTKVPWITVEETVFVASKKTIIIHIKPDMMKTGLNMATVLISTQTGTIYIPISGTLFKPDYPLIRFDKVPIIFPVGTIIIRGKTDGYRLFLHNQEISMDLEGNFSVKLPIQEGFNLFLFQSMNMQRKMGHFPILIIGFRRE
ncbi:hypothetical protein LLG10_00350 [bacterium]|nr:hypothetical protein [bacterium]